MLEYIQISDIFLAYVFTGGVIWGNTDLLTKKAKLMWSKSKFPPMFPTANLLIYHYVFKAEK